MDQDPPKTRFERLRRRRSIAILQALLVLVLLLYAIAIVKMGHLG